VIGRIMNVQISCQAGRPGGEFTHGPDGDYGFEYEHEGGTLAALYGALLGMHRYDPGYIKLKHDNDDGGLPEFGFESTRDEPRPRWPDPNHPQQVHLDIEVGNLDVAETLVVGLGATRLHDSGEYRVFADPVGHPFCLYADPALNERPEGPLPGRLARVVFDCLDPRALSRFYEELLDMRERVVDTPERVVIAAMPGPAFAFQQSQCAAPRWPDPAYPAQVHLDLGFDGRDDAMERMAELGAVHLATLSHHSVYADPAGHPFCV
jgi:Glyoxalase-like domain